MDGDGRVTSVDPLPADLPDESLDPLGRDVQFGQFGRASHVVRPYTPVGDQPAFLFAAVGTRLGFDGVSRKPLRQECGRWIRTGQN
jgi:hypothetical protein